MRGRPTGKVKPRFSTASISRALRFVYSSNASMPIDDQSVEQ